MLMPDQIFCHVDAGLVDLIKRLAQGRAVVDCGCGKGMLGAEGAKAGLKVISIDVNERENELVQVLRMDVCKFPFRADQFPVFLRPCHGHFVDDALTWMQPHVANALYVSKPQNLEDDVDTEGYQVTEVDGWTGQDGERAYLIKLKGKWEAQAMREFWLVKLDFWNLPTWMEKGKDGWLRHASGGGFPTDRMTGLEVLKKENLPDWDGLNWEGTVYDDPNSAEGWLTPEGRFYGCSYGSHDTAAYTLFQCSSHEAQRKGYARIHARSTFEDKPVYYMGGDLEGEAVKPTAAQVAWLRAKGFEIWPHHLESDQ